MKQVFKISLLVIIMFLSALLQTEAQIPDSVPVIGIIEKGDTLIYKTLPEVTVFSKPEFDKPRHERQYNRYVERVKKVYPYAKLAGEMLAEYEPKYLALEDDKERRKMMKELEKKLLSEYKDDMKKMTISDGRVLLKLIDRETSKTSFTLIKEFRGGASAFFWQSIARIFKNDLKSEYDPFGEDMVLEQIVTLIEIGYF